MKAFLGVGLVVGLGLGVEFLVTKHMSDTRKALDEHNHIQAIEAVLKSDPLMNDPDSVQVINWTVFDETTSTWQTKTTFRAKNGFGGYVVSHARIDFINGKAKIEYTP
jgi:hypothetical protein